MRPSGIHPVLYAFFDADGRLDPAAMARQVDYCLSHGAHGIVVLGLVTEVHKMTTPERLHLVDLVGNLIGGRVPYGVTIAEPDHSAQVGFARDARAAGADWVILQPPTDRSLSQAQVIRHFGQVADALDIPVAVQNNPVNLPVWLPADALVSLNRQHPNIAILKAEGWSIDIARTLEQSQGAYTVLGGHGGIEFPSLLRAGGHGLIPAPDFLPAQVRMYDLWQQGTPDAREQAARIHRQILPAIVFMSRTVPGMLCYGKRLFARQAGIGPVHDRMPAHLPTEFGLSEMLRHHAEIAAAIAAQGEMA